MKYFLDTNIISYILNGNEKVKNRIEEILLNNDIISIPIFSYYEIKKRVAFCWGKCKNRTI